MDAIRPHCDICDEGRVNPITRRCSHCKARYDRNLPWGVGGALSVITDIAVWAGAIYSIYVLSLWPFLLAVGIYGATLLLGKLEPDHEDMYTAHAIKVQKHGQANPD